MLGVLVPSTVFYLYLLLNGNVCVIAPPDLVIDVACVIVVPSAEIGSFKLDGKSGSSMDAEKMNFYAKQPALENLRSENDRIEVKA